MYYLIRHGEPDYSEKNTKIYHDIGIELSPLTENGRQQIKNVAKDPRLKNADIIISSPYTRALQTAAILSKELNIDIIVETDLHEWKADKSYTYVDDEIAEKSYLEYVDNKGCYPEGEARDWETADMMRERFINVLCRYKNYGNVIVTCHGMLMEAVTGLHHPRHGEIFEFEF